MSFSAAGFYKIRYFSVETSSVSQRLVAEEGEIMKIVITCGHQEEQNIQYITWQYKILGMRRYWFYQIVYSNGVMLLHRLKSSVPVIPQRSLPCRPFTTTVAV